MDGELGDACGACIICVEDAPLTPERQVLLPTSVFNASYCNTLKGDVSGNAGSPWVAQSSGRELGLSVAGALVATAFTIWSLATWAL